MTSLTSPAKTSKTLLFVLIAALALIALVGVTMLVRRRLPMPSFAAGAARTPMGQGPSTEPQSAPAALPPEPSFQPVAGAEGSQPAPEPEQGAVVPAATPVVGPQPQPQVVSTNGDGNGYHPSPTANGPGNGHRPQPSRHRVPRPVVIAASGLLSLAVSRKVRGRRH